MATQIRLNQLHPEVFQVMSSTGVYDVDIQIPLSSGFYDIGTAIAATAGETTPPTFLKFSASSTSTEVWYFQLEKPYGPSDYLNSSNWVLILNDTDLPDYFTPTQNGVDWWDTE